MANEERDERFGGEANEGLEASAYDSHHASAVHARPIYLGSGHYEFPCGIDGRTPAMVAAFDDEVTCPGCKAALAARGFGPMPGEQEDPADDPFADSSNSLITVDDRALMARAMARSEQQRRDFERAQKRRDVGRNEVMGWPALGRRGGR